MQEPTRRHVSLPDTPKEHVNTNWGRITVACCIACLTSVENTVLGVSEFAYLERATSNFYNSASSLGRLGHAIFALIFSFWAYKTKKVRAPLIFGRVISLVTCLVYLSIEHFPSDRRYIMGACYLFFDIATSAPTVLRVFIVVESSKTDRPRAYAALTLANWIAVVIGPVFQLLVSFIRYPGVELFFGFRFHIFSAPVWLALSLNFISIILILGLLRDPSHNNDDSHFSFLLLVEKLLSIPRMNVNWTLVGLCWALRIVANLSVVTLMALTTPLLMVVYGYSGEDAVLANSISSSLVGVLALTVCSCFMFSKVTKKIDPLHAFCLSLVISLILYAVTFPYPLVTGPLLPYNETTRAGCDPTKYPWCDSPTSGFPILFLLLAAIQTGVGLPMAQISLDTMYSRILGHIDQNILQGAFVAFEDLIFVLGPLYASSIFTSHGQGTLWLINTAVEVAGVGLFLVMYRWY